MTNTLQMLIDSEGFMPHGHCYLWTPSLLWTYVLSDALIGIAYFSIPLALIVVLKRRPDIPFHRIFGMFSLFIFVCGATHLMSIWTIWHPTYWLDALLKALTATVSVLTAIMLWCLLPRVQQLTTHQQLQDVIEQLEHEIIERKLLTEELKRSGEEIMHKNHELETVSRTKSAFLANMSHELRTPLNAVIGFTGTLLMRLPGPLTADQERQLEIIASSSSHLLSLINDLLDLAKIESGKIELRHEAVICQDLLYGIADSFRMMAQQKGLAFQLDMPADEIVVFTDQRALSQIIINLINNAIKFTDSGEVLVELRTRQMPEDGWVDIIVCDTGIGISTEQEKILFQAFGQIDATLTRRFKGTGLGLYLSLKLAELLGGGIVVSSTPGAGSRFVFSIPMQ